MALKFADRVKETTTTTGTGTINLGGAASGYQGFVAGVGTGNTCYYVIAAGTEWEVGLGTVTDAAPDTLSRTTVLSSSNAGALVNFSAGTKDVFCVAPAAILAAIEPSLQDFRLTLTSATPITTSDVTAATTLYAAPYKGETIALYDGTSKWDALPSTEMSIAVPATTNTLYDVFCYNNSGTPTLELTAWTNDTTRATALVMQNGILVKTGATTRRYLGSFRTTGVSGQTEDSLAKRYLWNYYHRVKRPMVVNEATNTWTYTTATIRQANGATTNQLDYVQGVSEDPVAARIFALGNNSLEGNTFSVGVGVDSTTTFSGRTGQNDMGGGNTGYASITASYLGYPGVGRHYLAWNEYSVASGSTTWYGDNGAALIQSGIEGEIWG